MAGLVLTCVLGLLSTPAVATRAESLVVSQSPKVISRVKVNSTAEIRCSTTLSNPTGLYLMRRFSKEMDVLYLSFAALKLSVIQEYKHRLSLKGQCCDYTLQLSQLGVKDTDGYYCKWSQLNSQSGSLKTYESTDTIIIIRDGDPFEDCNRIRTLHQILLLLSVTVSVVVGCVFIGVLVWWCTRTKESYRPARVYRQHHRLCLQHSEQRHIYPID